MGPKILVSIGSAFAVCVLFLALVLSGHLNWEKDSVDLAREYERTKQLEREKQRIDEQIVTQQAVASDAHDAFPQIEKAIEHAELAYPGDDGNALSFPWYSTWLTGRRWLRARIGIVVACVNCDEVLANYKTNSKRTLVLRNVATRASCSSDELSIVARFMGPVYVAYTAVAVPGRCEWHIPFELSYPGDYRLEIKLLNWHGLTDWTKLIPCPQGMMRKTRLKGKVLYVRNGTLYDECSCHYWCARIPQCSATHFEKYKENGGSRTCTLYTGPVTNVTTGEKWQLAGRMNLSPAERASLPTFLAHQRNQMTIPVNASSSIVFGSQQFSAQGPPKILSKTRPQCREIKPHHNVWKTIKCDHTKFPVQGGSYRACRGVLYKEGLGKCYVASEKSVGVEIGFYLEPEECEYRFFPPKKILQCLVDLAKEDPNAPTSGADGKPWPGVTRVRFDGASLAGMLYWDMPSSKEVNVANGHGWFIGAKQPPNQPGVYVGNVKMMHRIWHDGPPRKFAEKWKKEYLPYLDTVKARHKFFFTAPSLMSEREPHDTFDRAMFINEISRRDMAERPDWHVIPMGNITLPLLIDKSCINDGMHATSNIRRMVIQMIANVLCDASKYLS